MAVGPVSKSLDFPRTAPCLRPTIASKIPPDTRTRDVSEIAFPPPVAAPTSPKRGLPAALRAIGHGIANAVSSTLAGVRMVYYGEIYNTENAITEYRESKSCMLEGLPVPQIQRPFVIVPGWTSTPDNFDHLVHFLTRDGANGGQPYFVKQGAFYTLDDNGQLQPTASPPTPGRVFEIVWTDTRHSPDQNLAEMRQNLDAICNCTGADKVDAEGYSMGGFDARLYIDQGGPQINRFMMLGTPNHGTRFAELVLPVLEKNVTWAQKLAGVSMDDYDAMQWLREEKNNPRLQDLNSRWDQQRAAVRTLAVGTTVMPTPAETVTGLGWGDGMVPHQSLSLPDGDTIVLNDAMNHGRLNDDATVQHIRALFFGWKLPQDAESLFPPDKDGVLARVPRPT